MTASDAAGIAAMGRAGAGARSDAFLGPSTGTRDARKVAAEFAGLFYGMVLAQMQKTVPRNEYFGSRGEEVFRAMWVDEVGRQMAERKGDPLTEAIVSQIAQHGVRPAESMERE